MSKKLNLTFELENGKKGMFTISKIKEISAEEAGNRIKDFKFNEVMEIKGQKVIDLKAAALINTTSEAINLNK